MKIVTKSNFDENIYVELVVAENVQESYGKQLVDQWNNKYHTENSDDYLKLVEDNYVPYDGYAQLL